MFPDSDGCGALREGGGKNPKADISCEYPTWWNATGGFSGSCDAVAGGLGAGFTSAGGSCHGLCCTGGEGRCPTSSCVANKLGDDELNCPHSAQW